MTAYLTLAATAFLAATLFPAQSELLLAYLLARPELSAAALLAAATLGNVAGSCVNWALGRFFRHYRDRRWFPVSPARQARAEAFYRRRGRWGLLLAWVPVIGDPITLMAGMLGEDFRVFVALVTLAKAARYLAIAAATLAWI